jgi:hypothetical protein
VNPAQLLAELKAKPGEAAALAGGVVLVVVLALRKRSSAARSSSGTLDGSIAGLSGTPDTAVSDLGSQLGDQIADMQQQISRLSNGSSSSSSSGAAKPAGDPRKPGYQLYRLSATHQTLRSLAQFIYGIATPGNMQALLAANPQLKFVGGKASGDAKIIGNRNTGVWAPLPQTGMTPPSPATPTGSPAPVPAPSVGYVAPQGSVATPVHPATATVARGQSLMSLAEYHYGPENAPQMAAALAAHNSVPVTTNRDGAVTYHTTPGQRLDLL